MSAGGEGNPVPPHQRDKRRARLRLERPITGVFFARILKIVTDAGYHGYVGIEYEGRRLGEPEGIRATKKLLESLRGSTYQPIA